MNQLVKRVMTIGARLAPMHRTAGTSNRLSIQRYMLPIAFHRELLQVGWEPFEVLFVWQYRNCFRSEEIVVPDGNDSHDHGQIVLKRRGSKVFVHLMEASQHRVEVFRTDG